MATTDLILPPRPTALIPAPVAELGAAASERFLEFFAASIRNPNTREAYARAVFRFMDWCETKGVGLLELRPLHVATYIEQLTDHMSKPSVKQHLAAIRMLMDYLVTGQQLPGNPAAAVRGPKYIVRTGKTPVLNAEEAAALFSAIDSTSPSGLRDRALLAVMAYGFARIGAVLAMNVEDFAQEGRRVVLRLHEKGGKHHQIPAHHKIIEYMDAYLAAAGIASAQKSPLFRTIGPNRTLSDNRLQRREALALVKRRSVAAGLGMRTSNHSFRATGITNFLANGGSIETAQRIAAHESPTTTKLYDRTGDEITIAEIERIRF